MDKATVESVMALLNPCCVTFAKWKELGKRGRTAEEEDAALREMRDAQEAFRAEVERLAAQAAPTEPDLDTLRSDFHKWCATNGYKTGFVVGGECPMGRPVYEDHRTHAAWWAFQKAAKLYAVAQSAPLAQQAGQPPQEFESAQGRKLATAWAEGWAQCRDAEYVGEEAEGEAFNQSNTLAECLHADQTRFQGGLSNDELRRAWSAKLPNVIPTDEQLTAFALGIEAAAQPSQAPVVLAVQPEYCTACDMTSNDKQRCEDCPRRASSGATTQAVRMLTRDELNDVALSEQVGWGPGEYVEAIQRKFCEVNKLRIPADGVIGGV